MFGFTRLMRGSHRTLYGLFLHNKDYSRNVSARIQVIHMLTLKMFWRRIILMGVLSDINAFYKSFIICSLGWRGESNERRVGGVKFRDLIFKTCNSLSIHNPITLYFRLLVPFFFLQLSLSLPSPSVNPLPEISSIFRVHALNLECIMFFEGTTHSTAG